jgi:very-short-patch-repair endonuclease
MDGFDRRVAMIAARQHGLVTRRDARRIGGTDAAVARRLASGRWEAVLPGVFRIGGARATFHQRAMAAALWGGDGCGVSHGCASSLLHLDGASTIGGVHLTVLRTANPRSREGFTVHRSLLLGPHDLVTVDGVPCTGAARTIVDLAGVAAVSNEALEAAFESARRMGLTTTERVVACLEALGPRRRGAARLRRMLLHVGDAPALESRLETRVARLLRRSGLPAPVRQHVVTARDGRRYRLDFAWPRARVALEAEGFAWHGGRLQWKRDRRRTAALEAMGWRLVAVTWDDVTRRPEETLHRLGLALGAA